MSGLAIAGHAARFDAQGRLLPWTSWNAALDKEMQFYQECPSDRGYPRFAYVTFLDSRWTPVAERTDNIPATQIGMGIISYLKYYDLRGQGAAAYLDTARAMGDYLIRETLTPDGGNYPRFTRSTGKRDQFPLAPDAGSQADRPYEIEPDKGGIAGHALAMLFAASGEQRYLQQALQNARVLAANQDDADAAHSPWPFRVDHRDGAARGAVSGNMVYILRLYDNLLAQGYAEFSAPRRALWNWIDQYQIPSAAGNGNLFAQFFEDHDTPTNRTAWAPLNLARYLLERQAALDPEWQRHCATLIDFVRRTFTHRELGVTVCHEQDEDTQAWGGINSTYGAVLAQYCKATASTAEPAPTHAASALAASALAASALAAEARSALDFTLYSIDELGRPRDLFTNPVPGGWQEDAHTDVIHNYVDALSAFPEWGLPP